MRAPPAALSEAVSIGQGGGRKIQRRYQCPGRGQPNGADAKGVDLHQDGRAPNPEVMWIRIHEPLMPIRVSPDDVGRRSVFTTDVNDGTEDLTTPGSSPSPYKLIANIRSHGSRPSRSGPSRSSCGCLPLDDQSPKYSSPIYGEGIPQGRLDLGTPLTPCLISRPSDQ